MPNQHLDKSDVLHKMKRGRWSKYGGAIYGVDKEHLEEWTCQACGQKQTDQLPAYMFQLFPGEFIRICAKCHRIVKVENIEEFRVLRIIVKKKPLGY